MNKQKTNNKAASPGKKKYASPVLCKYKGGARRIYAASTALSTTASNVGP